MSTALEIRGLSVSYGAVVALNEVSLETHSGTVHGIIGPNGAGKTTLLDASSGFIGRATGDVLLDGVSLKGLPPHKRVRKGLRRTFQQSRSPEDVSALRYVKAVAGRRISNSEIEDLLNFFGIPDSSAQMGELDVPTRRLAEVAAAVSGKPRVLMLDEPAAGLGEAESIRLATAIQSIPEMIDGAVLLIEHDIELVRQVCSEVTVLDFGTVIGRGTPDEALATDAVRLAYLGKLED